MHSPANLIRDGARVEISIDALHHNYRTVREHIDADVDILCSLKSNGYGLGAGQVAGYLSRAGADGFAVGSLRDALEIRAHNATARILLYGGIAIECADIVAANKLSVTLSNLHDIELWGRTEHKPHECFLKIDTGLNRFGVDSDQLRALSELRDPFLGLNVIGVYTHLTGAGPENPGWAKQKAIFEDALTLVKRHFPAVTIRCAASSAHLLHPLKLEYDCIDIGGLLFGLPSRTSHGKLSTRHTLIGIKASIAAIQTRPESVHGILEPRVCTYGVVRFGWGDGFPRKVPTGAYALVNGQPTAFVGPVHLEHVRLDLSGRGDVRVGDEVVILGRQGDASISPDDLAKQWNWGGCDDVYGNLRGHLPRVFL